MSKNNKKISENVTINEKVVIARRSYFSIQHIQSAAYFARLSAKIEESDRPGDANNFDRLLADHKACVIATIFASVSFLEANINELFSDSLDFQNGVVKELNDSIKNEWQMFGS